jgi:hypothetical protein
VACASQPALRAVPRPDLIAQSAQPPGAVKQPQTRCKPADYDPRPAAENRGGA